MQNHIQNDTANLTTKYSEITAMFVQCYHNLQNSQIGIRQLANQQIMQLYGSAQAWYVAQELLSNFNSNQMSNQCKNDNGNQNDLTLGTQLILRQVSSEAYTYLSQQERINLREFVRAFLIGCNLHFYVMHPAAQKNISECWAMLMWLQKADQYTQTQAQKQSDSYDLISDITCFVDGQYQNRQLAILVLEFMPVALETVSALLENKALQRIKMETFEDIETRNRILGVFQNLFQQQSTSNDIQQICLALSEWVSQKLQILDCESLVTVLLQTMMRDLQCFSAIHAVLQQAIEHCKCFALLQNTSLLNALSHFASQSATRNNVLSILQFLVGVQNQFFSLKLDDDVQEQQAYSLFAKLAVEVSSAFMLVFFDQSLFGQSLTNQALSLHLEFIMNRNSSITVHVLQMNRFWLPLAMYVSDQLEIEQNENPCTTRILNVLLALCDKVKPLCALDTIIKQRSYNEEGLTINQIQNKNNNNNNDNNLLPDVCVLRANVELVLSKTAIAFVKLKPAYIFEAFNQISSVEEINQIINQINVVNQNQNQDQQKIDVENWLFIFLSLAQCKTKIQDQNQTYAAFSIHQKGNVLMQIMDSCVMPTFFFHSQVKLLRVAASQQWLGNSTAHLILNQFINLLRILINNQTTQQSFKLEFLFQQIGIFCAEMDRSQAQLICKCIQDYFAVQTLQQLPLNAGIELMQCFLTMAYKVEDLSIFQSSLMYIFQMINSLLCNYNHTANNNNITIEQITKCLNGLLGCIVLNDKDSAQTAVAQSVILIFLDQTLPTLIAGYTDLLIDTSQQSINTIVDFIMRLFAILGNNLAPFYLSILNMMLNIYQKNKGLNAGILALLPVIFDQKYFQYNQNQNQMNDKNQILECATNILLALQKDAIQTRYDPDIVMHYASSTVFVLLIHPIQFLSLDQSVNISQDLLRILQLKVVEPKMIQKILLFLEQLSIQSQQDGRVLDHVRQLQLNTQSESAMYELALSYRGPEQDNVLRAAALVLFANWRQQIIEESIQNSGQKGTFFLETMSQVLQQTPSVQISPKEMQIMADYVRCVLCHGQQNQLDNQNNLIYQLLEALNNWENHALRKNRLINMELAIKRNTYLQ